MKMRHPGLAALLMSAMLPLALPAAAAAQAETRAKAQAQAKPPHVMAAWVRLPAVGGRPAGGYFTAHGTARDDALVGASSPKAERIELHSMRMENGVMRMRAETSVPLPAGGELAFRPGGHHLMLFGLAPDVKAGQTIPLTLRFRSGAVVTVAAEVRAVTAPAPAAGQHGHH